MASPSGITVQAVQSIGLTVSDASQAADFFTGAFDYTVVSDTVISGDEASYLYGVPDAQVRIVSLALGQETIRLMQFLSGTGEAIPTDSKSNDLWFQHFAIIVSDMDKAYERLKKFSFTPISPEPQMLPNDIKAFKFRDTDGHPLELLQFPPGLGPDYWQSKEALFLGMDHSAIAISSTETSLSLYRDVLGLTHQGSFTNIGIKQETMDNLFSAKVIVTSLTPAQGRLGVEFLDYLTPPGARPFPLDQQTNDLVHMHFELLVDDIDAAVEVLEEAHVQFVSPKVIDLPDVMPFKRGVLWRGPDGHNMLLVES
ncbi:glyoxalase family protein [Synechococcus sp. PCC 7335]|uniref:VOC family protein n=1 Tax=Synechococcus sp. (strain ATCC 29403 / PCC 7335) TaxID=91464 RepID=UPI00017ED561|nr:VOC family protein [Synechococcus sp. PCC 7335]EDX87462.1 glyoxalase family protein [Synechococcus sp. PCC 7335]